MNTRHVIERALILALLFVAILQLGGATVRADLGTASSAVATAKEGLAEKYCRVVGFPHNDIEAVELLMRIFR